MKFRTDINGLRALAVIAVVLFHFNPSWVPGGFAGVDVFFVISGFLMTGLIFRGLENNNFSIINFYVARANRIIPALSVVCLVLLVFGWFYITPLDYKAIGKHVASSMGFVSNIIYWRESGYFDAAAKEKWLLHTWSLSVEWQFYMIYPVVLVLLKKCMSLTNIKRLLVVGTVVGFIFSVYATYRWPSPAYFFLPTRAWEMMMGGLAFLYPLQNLKETSKKYLEWVGIALILASYAFISKDNLWPGYLALIPVLGAYLVIIANRSGSVITDNIVMQKVGLWSYSIYLWHWPVVVFGYYFGMQYWEWIGIPISVVLGFCSYKFVESIKFESFFLWTNIFKVKPIYTSIFLIFISIFVFLFNGVESRFSGRIKYVNEVMKDIEFPLRSNGYCFYSKEEIGYPNKDVGVECYLNRGEGKRVLLFGSSYAGMYEPFWRDFAKDNGWSINSITSSWCAPYLNNSFPRSKVGTPEYQQCMYNRNFVKANIDSYDVIVLAGLWAVRYKSKTIDYIKETIELALSKGIKIIIMPSPVSYAHNPMERLKSSLWRDKQYKHFKNNDLENKEANAYVSSISADLGAYFVTREQLFSHEDFYLKDGWEVPYSLDGGHISKEGALKAYHFMMTNGFDRNIISYVNN